MTTTTKRLSVPKLENLKTVKQLCETFPDLFTEGSLRWLIFNAERNGFAPCIIRMSPKRLLIDEEALEVWLAKHRDQLVTTPSSIRR